MFAIVVPPREIVNVTPPSLGEPAELSTVAVSEIGSPVNAVV